MHYIYEENKRTDTIQDRKAKNNDKTHYIND